MVRCRAGVLEAHLHYGRRRRERTAKQLRLAAASASSDFGLAVGTQASAPLGVFVAVFHAGASQIHSSNQLQFMEQKM